MASILALVCTTAGGHIPRFQPHLLNMHSQEKQLLGWETPVNVFCMNQLSIVDPPVISEQQIVSIP